MSKCVFNSDVNYRLLTGALALVSTAAAHSNEAMRKMVIKCSYTFPVSYSHLCW